MIETAHDLAGKVALVTGGTRGIGAATARLLARRGARVTISSRRQEACNAAVRAFGQDGLDVHGIESHAGDPDDTERLVAAALDRFGRLDIVVANAGANPVAAPLADLPQAAWDKTIATNLAGPWHLARHALPAIAAAGGGAMVAVSSINARLGMAGAAAYGVAKAGLDQLIRQLAVEWGPHAVRVNGVAPGTIRTDMIRALAARPGLIDDVVARTPLRRLGEPDDVAEAILFLASAAARHVTGQILTIDGGETIARA